MTNVKLTRLCIIIFLIAVAIAFITFGALCTNPTMKIFFSPKVFRDMKQDIYNIENEHAPHGAVLFVGDSITEMYDIDAHYKHTDYKLINRGISAETSDETLNRLTMNVMSIAPSKVILLIGTNDLGKGVTPSEIVDNITAIASKIRYFNKDTEIYIESILPVNDSANFFSKSIVDIRKNEDIDTINRALKANAVFFGYTFIDTNTALKDENGILKREYTIDGLHITDAGYDVMTKTILEYIA